MNTGWRLAIGSELVLHGIGYVLGILAATTLGGERCNAGRGSSLAAYDTAMTV